MEYNFRDIEKKWREYWEENNTFRAENKSNKPKYYVLDMFPYPSGAGLHVGHPLGYIASDIVARYKRLNGYNVLHPMGFDAFGLPAEQYAIQTGQHPAATTEQNTRRYVDQLKNIGFSYDWDRAVNTSDPNYYKWTQWIFLLLFNSWYDEAEQKARPINELISLFETKGNKGYDKPLISGNVEQVMGEFSADEWNNFSDKTKSDILMCYRLAYQSYAYVNWCEALGTVLANDEVKDGVSERGGHPVERREMRQWFLRITSYAERLLKDLDTLQWSDSMKEMQRNWIGKSEGALIRFDLTPTLSGREGANKPGYNTANPGTYPYVRPHQKENRKSPTEAENILWQHVRNKKTGHKIRRQHIIDSYITDFVCLSKKLVIEVDGDYHDTIKEEDQIRTNRLNELGYQVIRFKNEEVINDVYSVIKKIAETLDSLPSGEGKGGVESSSESIEIFTTRPDTIFGVTFMVLAPESEWVNVLTTAEQKSAVEAYVNEAKNRSERERQADVKKVSGVFTGAYVQHPFTGEDIPVWIGDYVLAGYGTGAVMAVPGHDSRDFRFAQHFGLPIPRVIAGPDGDTSELTEAYEAKDGTLVNSDFITGMQVKEAIKAVIDKVEEMEIGERQVNYRLRDANFSRQRYWGEPFPIYYKDDVPHGLAVEDLPLELPKMEDFKPTGNPEGPLAKLSLDEWNYKGYPLETDTMPGFAGSSWYFLRYMDARNNEAFASKEALHYWQDVDFYIGGTEHAVGHLLYSRFWHKVLFDYGYVPTPEPFKKLVNQGMIQGRSSFIYRAEGPYAELLFQEFISKKGIKYERIFWIDNEVSCSFYLPENDLCVEITNTDKNRLQVQRLIDKCISKRQKFYVIDSHLILNSANLLDKLFEKIMNEPIGTVVNYGFDYFELFVSHNKLLTDQFPYITKHNIDVNFVENDILQLDRFNDNRFHLENSKYILEDGKYICGWEVEKMSKSKLNVVNPDQICEDFGADTLRMYEMFLGPIEQAKPWNTNGIEGVHKFLKKLWRTCVNEDGTLALTDEEPEKKEWKSLHKTIKKISEDIENLSLNTSISAFMICMNELGDLKCRKKKIFEPLMVILSPYAPHIAEEIWQRMGHTESIAFTAFPEFKEEYLVENSFNYPVSFNGKPRFTIELPLGIPNEEIQQAALSHPDAAKWLEGKTPKKVIVVPGKIVNVVV